VPGKAAPSRGICCEFKCRCLWPQIIVCFGLNPTQIGILPLRRALLIFGKFPLPMRTFRQTFWHKEEKEESRKSGKGGGKLADCSIPPSDQEIVVEPHQQEWGIELAGLIVEDGIIQLDSTAAGNGQTGNNDWGNQKQMSRRWIILLAI
jgi:hypothetical protein